MKKEETYRLTNDGRKFLAALLGLDMPVPEGVTGIELSLFAIMAIGIASGDGEDIRAEKGGRGFATIQWMKANKDKLVWLRSMLPAPLIEKT